MYTITGLFLNQAKNAEKQENLKKSVKICPGRWATGQNAPGFVNHLSI
jgi:hypothetical protein